MKSHHLFDVVKCEVNIPLLGLSLPHTPSLFVSHRQPSDPQNIVTVWFHSCCSLSLPLRQHRAISVATWQWDLESLCYPLCTAATFGADVKPTLVPNSAVPQIVTWLWLQKHISPQRISNFTAWYIIWPLKLISTFMTSVQGVKSF